jgi:hypothetical protein
VTIEKYGFALTSWLGKGMEVTIVSALAPGGLRSDAVSCCHSIINGARDRSACHHTPVAYRDSFPSHADCHACPEHSPRAHINPSTHVFTNRGDHGTQNADHHYRL